MFWRLLLGLALGYLAYRIFVKVKHSLGLEGRKPPGGHIPEPEELVQDPVCGTFIPRKNALKATRNGKDYFFCSEGCLKGFMQNADKYLQK